MSDADPNKPIIGYASEGIKTGPGDDEYVVAMVQEDEPGYWESTYTGTLDYCKAVAASINESQGIAPDEAMRVVFTTMRSVS